MRTKIRSVVYVHEKNNRNSSILNTISLASGDGTSGGNDGNLVHYCAEFVVLGLCVLSASGGLPGWVPIV